MSSLSVSDQLSTASSRNGWSKSIGKLLVSSVTVILVAIVVRIPFLSVPFETDEAGYAYTAYWWSKGLRLYSDLWFDRPQAIFVLYRAILATLGSSVVSVRIAGAIVSAGSAWLVYLIAKRCFDRQTALLAGFLFAIFSCAPQIEGFTSNAETFMICPAICALYLFLRGRDTRNKWWFFLAGFSVSIAAQIKPSELATGLLLVILTRVLFDRGRISALVLMASGFAVALLPAIIHGYITGWNTFTFAVIRYRLIKDSIATRSIGWHLEILFGSLQQIAPALIFLFVFSALAFLALWRSSRGILLLPACWLATSVAGVALGGNWYYHYFIQMVAPLSVTAAVGILALYRSTEPTRRTIFVAGLTLTLVVAFCFAFRVVMLGDPKQIGYEIYYRRDRVIYNEEIADYLRARTGPDDHLYVIYSDPEILFMSKRRASYPFLYHKELERLDPDGAKLVQSLTDPATRPHYIVDMINYGAHPAHDPLVINILRRDYKFDRRFGANIIYCLKE